MMAACTLPVLLLLSLSHACIYARRSASPVSPNTRLFLPVIVLRVSVSALVRATSVKRTLVLEMGDSFLSSRLCSDDAFQVGRTLTHLSALHDRQSKPEGHMTEPDTD